MLSKIKLIQQFWTHLSWTLRYAGFRTAFVLVVTQKLSWVCTFEVFAPQNGLNLVNLGPKQLCRAYKKKIKKKWRGVQFKTTLVSRHGSISNLWKDDHHIIICHHFIHQKGIRGRAPRKWISKREGMGMHWCLKYFWNWENYSVNLISTKNNYFYWWLKTLKLTK